MSNKQGKQPTIFLIEEDDETRNPLVENLRNEGYRVIITLNEAGALELAGDWRIKADLVLVNLVGKSAEMLLEVGRRVRARAKKDGHTSLVVMPDKYEKDVEGTDVNVEVNDWIHYLGEDPDQLKNLLARLIKLV